MNPQPFDLNLRHLRAVDAIVQRGSMNAAANAVNLSQPALTQGLAKLERQLGQTLFERHPDGMVPTDAGRAFAARIAGAMAQLADAARAMSRGAKRGFARPDHLMTSTQVGAFLALADAGSFVGAARATGLSQPALHRAVRDLEQLGSSALVDRRGRGIQLTDPGRRVARGIRLAALEIKAAIAEAGGAASDPDGRITIGAMPLCRALLLPAAVARLTAEAPRLTLDIVEGSWRELVDPLRDGVIDLMIGALRPDPLPGLEQRPLFVDRLAIIARSAHPLARQPAPDPSHLRRYPWIVGRAGTPLRSFWEALFSDQPLPPAPIECGSVMTIRGILRDSDFLTLLSPDQVAAEIAAGMLAQIAVPLQQNDRSIGVTYRAGWRPTAGQERLLALLGEAASEQEFRFPNDRSANHIGFSSGVRLARDRGE